MDYEKSGDDLLSHTIGMGGRMGFLGHVFSTTEEGKGEIMNVVQYSAMAIIPVILLNKSLQKYIPDADQDASTLEIVTEILLQVIIIFTSMILIHRTITFIPTYSGFRYEPFILTNAVLTFLVIVFSLQTKIGMKSAILYDRVLELIGWNDRNDGNSSGKSHKSHNSYNSFKSNHQPSQSDFIDANPSGIFPPTPISTTGGRSQGNSGLLDSMIPTKPIHNGGGGGGGGGSSSDDFGQVYGPTSSKYENNGASSFGPMAANSLLGSSFT